MLLAFLLLFSLEFLLHLLKVPKFLTPPSKSHYLAAFIRYISISYTSLLLTPLQLLQCVSLPFYLEKKVWFHDGNVECMQKWQYGWLVFLSVLIPLPMIFIIVMLSVWRNESQLSKPERRIWDMLSNGFCRERSFWLGLSLYRRFFLVLAFTQVCFLFLFWSLASIIFRV